MLNIYLTDRATLAVNSINDYVPDCWIHMTSPTADEMQWVLDHTPADPDFMRASLDEEERSRVESENEQIHIVVDTPYVTVDDAGQEYETVPLAIVLLKECIITVCSKNAPIISDFSEGYVKSFSTRKRNRFILQILHRNAARFLLYLRQIDRLSGAVEKKLYKSMKNKELISMLKLEKSLVYFSTSLKGNEAVFERLLRMPFIREYPDDTDLLEDLIIENKQAIEMCSIYRDILSSMTDGFASVISNNLNVIMKRLTIVTIVLTVPTIIGGLWGMNVPVPLADNDLGFWIVLVIIVIISIIATIILKFTKMF